MGLITKEVEVKLSRNIKHYESLGYEIPKRYSYGKTTVPQGTTIRVKVEDLPEGSHVKVKIKCDCCGKEKEVKYQSYKKHNHNGKTYCNSCSNSIFTSGENNGMYGVHRYGEENPNYNPNKTDEERENGRVYPEYIEFIKKILARDKYTCQCCGKEHENIEVHHLDGYNWCIEKRTDETNGICLCHNCHKNFHSIYGSGHNTKEQFEEWIGEAIKLVKYEGELPTARRVYCIEEDKIYDSAIQLANEWNMSYTSIYSYCDHKRFGSVKNKHLLWFDEYENMSKEDIDNFIVKCNRVSCRNARQVICVTTNKVFNSISEGSQYYNCSTGNVTNCCKGKLKSTGKLPDGTKLQWMYYDEYLEKYNTSDLKPAI